MRYTRDMARRGAIPKSNDQRVRENDPNKARMRREVTLHGQPEMPRGMSSGAQAEWKRVVPELLRLGMLADIDRAALEAYCETYAQHREAMQDLRLRGRILTDDHGREYASPSLNAVKSLGSAMRAYFSQFGLTPAARARLERPAGDNEAKRQERELEDFLNDHS